MRVAQQKCSLEAVHEREFFFPLFFQLFIWPETVFQLWYKYNFEALQILAAQEKR